MGTTDAMFRIVQRLQTMDSEIAQAKELVNELYELCWEGESPNQKEIMPPEVTTKILRLSGVLESI